MKPPIGRRVADQLRRNRESIDRAERNMRWLQITGCRSEFIADHARANLQKAGLLSCK